MKTSPTIEFKQRLRWSVENQNRCEQAEAEGRAPKGLVYDYTVVVDGEVRGEFNKNLVSAGYSLRDQLGRNVPIPRDLRNGGYLHEFVIKEDFAAIIAEVLPNIPTVAFVEAERVRIAAAKAAKEAAEAERARRWAKRRQVMADALTQYIDNSRDGIDGTLVEGVDPEMIEIAQAIVDEIDAGQSVLAE